MNLQEQYFLFAAREKSITSAAKKLYISQQSLSRHIQQLEQQYNTVLFVRRPTFALTPAGECLARNLSKIAAAEANMKLELSSFSDVSSNSIRFGINQMYFTTICSDVLPAFHSQFPTSFLDVHHDDASLFAKACADGQLDMFLGSYEQANPLIQFQPVIDTVEFACVSDSLFREIYGAQTDQLIEKQLQEGLNPRLLEKIPCVIQNQNQSMGQKRLMEYFLRAGANIKTISACGGVAARAVLAMNNYAAFFTTELGVFFIKDYLLTPDSPKLHFFPMIDFDLVPLAVGWHRDRFFTQEERYLLSLIIKACQEKNKRTRVEFPSIQHIVHSV